ncbi:CPBP family intramembrane metalloprotease [Clostridium chromiireducens]|uniref:CPBP family intramembrane metalloprotease n=1 Tax=Clostridium chromiireducens TaxID=225345 RepID=A0A399IUF8_9CLOT|nr:type II CAAX endopeptidase family protein [Clostridium chromiireducens]RII36107.1 CPBP family intramembrane metalloprotease [Clostridium chromiireducens]
MRIFKNTNNQIRSGWKILIVFISFFVTTFASSFIFSALYGIIIFIVKPELLSQGDGGAKYISEQFTSMSSIPGAFISLLQCLLMIFFVILFWKIWDKRKVADMGLTSIKNSWKDLCIGLLSGAISFSLVAIILLCTKSVEMVNSINKPNFSWGLIIELIIFIFVGINEELFARGYCMTVLKQTKKAYVPIIVSSIIFALMHSLNQGISLIAYLNLFLFGLSMGYVFIKTKNIWISIGYHITWNYFQGDIFGFLVSGNSTNSIYNIKTVTPNLINGGSFGPEGGLVVTALLIATIFIIYKYLPERKYI